jgi:uncharacterized protein (DUF1697 family)
LVDRRVALLRGINVGKAKRIAMSDLRKLFEDLGHGDVRTVLNSGNVVFTVAQRGAAGGAAEIGKAIAARLGVTTRVTILLGREVAEAVRGNPLGSIANHPSRLLILALQDSKAAARLKPLLAERWTPDALALGRRVAYLWCPNGTIHSRLWASVDRIIGEAGTSRNLATMTKLLAVVQDS